MSSFNATFHSYFFSLLYLLYFVAFGFSKVLFLMLFALLAGNECGKSFLRKQQLADHTATAHTMTKEHRCDTCGWRANTRNALILHQRTHSGGCPRAAMHFIKEKVEKYIFLLLKKSHPKTQAI